jgi:hypothetical protein
MFISLGNEYFIIYKKVTMDKFVQASKVTSGSWAEELMNRVYDCLFGNITNIIEEYEKFYKVEYSTFQEFLRKRYGLKNKGLQLISDNLGKDDYLAHGFLDSEGDYNTAQLIEFSDELVESINKILASGEQE